MNVYDFDGTIYDGDSTVDFYVFALKKKPFLISYVPKQAWGFLLYLLKKINKVRLKEYFLSFLSSINTEKLTEEFWNQNQYKIFDWYLGQQREDDIIISASPAFLLQPICGRLNIHHLIASEVDPETGIFFGENCRGQEKVKRLALEYGVSHIDSFYSDSRSDFPLAKIAEKAYLVKKGIISEWQGIES